MKWLQQFLVSVFLLLFLPVSLPASDDLELDVQARIDAFDEIDRVFKSLRFYLVNQRSQSQEELLPLADELLTLSYPLAGLFAEESPRQLFRFSKARPEIWTRKAQFDGQLDRFVEALESIQTALQEGRFSEAARQVDLTAQGCRRCHQAFRYR